MDINVIDTDAYAYNGRMIAAGGLGMDAVQMEAVSLYFQQLKATGVFTNISRLGLFLGLDWTSAQVAAIVGTGANTSDTATGFTSADWSLATGLQGGTTGKYLRTGLTPANAGITNGSGHLVAYFNVASSNSGANVCIGVQSAASTLLSQLYCDTSAGTIGGRIGTNGGNSTTAITNRLGWLSLNALSSTMNFTWNSKSLLNTAIATSGSEPTLEYYVLARNDNGSGQSLYNNGRLAMYSIGVGLTQQQMVDFYQATQQLMNAIGRAYTPPFPMLDWGDSLTEGSGTTPWPTDLRTSFSRFTWNGGVGGQTSAQILARFQADPAMRAQATHIIWAGRNDVLTTGQAGVIANIQAMVDLLVAAGNNRYLILTIPNNDTEPSGSANYNTIIACNAAMVAAWGSHVWDVRAFLVTQWNQNNSTDVTNHSQDIPPSTLRADTLHPNSAGNVVIANQLAIETASRGYWP